MLKIDAFIALLMLPQWQKYAVNIQEFRDKIKHKIEIIIFIYF